MPSLHINAARLQTRLADMAEIGQTAGGGCNRQALTAEDQRGRALFLDWCHAIGGIETRDSMGNLFVRWPGTNPQLPPVLMGSHLDTQPSGGRYDGVYGVLAALEVLNTLHDAGRQTRHPLEIAVWMNEEGARFAPAMMGSGVFAGELDQQTMHQVTDKQGISVLQALQDSHQLGHTPCAAHPIAAALELHIEQGPVLEAKDIPIGIVTGVQGMHWFDITLTGATTHAGPTPMSMRRDPVQILAPLLQQLYSMVRSMDDDARITIGDIQTRPGSRNTVPAQITFSVDLRHPEQATLDAMTDSMFNLCQMQDPAIQITIDEIWRSPAVRYHPACIDAVTTAATQLGYPAMPIVSGAGHDSVYLSRIAPTGMIFIPCRDGISHNEQEYATPEQIAQGANVLLHSLLQLAGASEPDIHAHKE